MPAHPIHLLIFGVVLTTAFGCRPDEFVYSDNPVPHYDEISTILVKNYVNRMYIDLIGREPTDTEMDRDVVLLEGDTLSPEVRLAVINTLVSGTDSLDGTTYRTLYYEKLYTDLKARFLEGASDAVLNERYGLARSMAVNDSLNGNWAGYSMNQAQRRAVPCRARMPSRYGAAGNRCARSVCADDLEWSVRPNQHEQLQLRQCDV